MRFAKEYIIENLISGEIISTTSIELFTKLESSCYNRNIKIVYLTKQGDMVFDALVTNDGNYFVTGECESFEEYLRCNNVKRY